MSTEPTETFEDELDAHIIESMADPEYAAAVQAHLRDDTDASMLREARGRIKRGFAPGGSNTTSTVMAVLEAVADALDGGAP